MSNFTIVCEDCGFTSSDFLSAKVHSCYVQEMGGRCEDYPCCGHTDGDGCQTLASHTSEYWYDRLSREDYDPYYDESDY